MSVKSSPTSQRSWVRIPLKTPEIFQVHMRQSLRLFSKCEDHFFNSSHNHISQTFLSLNGNDDDDDDNNNNNNNNDNNNKTSHTTRFSCSIGRSADKQGPRFLEGHQFFLGQGVFRHYRDKLYKYRSKSMPLEQALPEENNAEDTPHRGLLSVNTTNPSKRTRQKLTRDVDKEVMKAYDDATLNPAETSVTGETYKIWRRKKPTKRPYLDANKLQSWTKRIENI